MKINTYSIQSYISDSSGYEKGIKGLAGNAGK